MHLTEIPAPDFDLAMTLDCGQVFHWEKAGDGFAGAIGDEPLYIEQGDEVVRFAGGSARLVRHYFALDHALPDICGSFPKDPVMNEARRFCRGLRIIRQPLWECLATFITSSMKQVAHIRQISRALRGRFGERCAIDGNAIYTFPAAETIAKLSERDLRDCALGYRAKNLLGTARLISSGKAELEAWSALSDDDLRTRLCQLPGVGAKVANCVMLFAYERLRAFPIDVWIGRVLKERYFPRKRKITEREMRDFSQDYFGSHGGYAQQYLFHHARKSGRQKRGSRDSSTALCSGRNDKKGSAGKSGRQTRGLRDSSTALRSGRKDKKGSAGKSGRGRRVARGSSTTLRSAQNDREEKADRKARAEIGGRRAVGASLKRKYGIRPGGSLQGTALNLSRSAG